MLPPPANTEKQHPSSERSIPKKRTVIIIILKNLAHLGRIPQTRKGRQICLWNPLAEAQRGETISLLGVAHGDGVGRADVIVPHVVKVGAVRRVAIHVLVVVRQQVGLAVSLPPRRLGRHVPCHRGQSTRRLHSRRFMRGTQRLGRGVGRFGWGMMSALR